MKTVEEIRRDNLRLLVQECGTVTELSKRLRKSAPQVSQWLNASIDAKSGKRRQMSAGIAREIEATLHKPYLWMDTPQDADSQDANAQVLVVRQDQMIALKAVLRSLGVEIAEDAQSPSRLVIKTAESADPQKRD